MTDDGSPCSSAASRERTFPKLPPVRDISTTSAIRIDAAPFPDWALIAHGKAWVSGVEPGLASFDLATGKRRDSVQIAKVCLAMDHGFESVWVASCDGNPVLYRVDGASGRPMAQIDLPAEDLADESSVGVGEGHVWVLSGSEPRRLIVIDPTTDHVLDSFTAPPNATAVRVGLGGVWVSTSDPGGVVRLHPQTGQIVAHTSAGRGARFLALSTNAVWVMNLAEGTISRIDPTLNRVVALVRVSRGEIAGGDIAATDHSVWVRVTDALVARVDTSTNETVDRLGPRVGSGSVAIADDSVWITAHDVQAIWSLPIKGANSTR